MVYLLANWEVVVAAMVDFLANRAVELQEMDPFLLVEVAPLVVLAACLRFLLVKEVVLMDHMVVFLRYMGLKVVWAVGTNLPLDLNIHDADLH